MQEIPHSLAKARRLQVYRAPTGGQENKFIAIVWWQLEQFSNDSRNQLRDYESYA